MIKCFLLTAFLTSCEEENLNSQNLEVLNPIITFDKANNNLVIDEFKNVKVVYNNLKEKDTDLNDKILSFFKDGFQPMALVEKATQEDINEYIKRKEENTFIYKKNDEEENELIKNDYLASILNEKGEIQVGDSIYRYTEDGLKYVHKEDRHLLDTSGKNNNDINLYIPNLSNLPDFTVSQQTQTCNENNISDLPDLTDAFEYYGCDGVWSGGGSGSGNGNGSGVSSTAHYTECGNSYGSWVDNVFGKSFVCEYKFTSKRKLRTIFEAADFYFFQDVYAQAKFKEKTWLGWFSNRDADEVYLLNKKVILKTETKKRGFDFTINWEDVKKVYNDIHTFFLSKPDESIVYISNEYDFDNKVTTNYLPNANNILSLSSNSLNVTIPPNKQSKQLLDIDFDLKNFFGKKVNKAVTINILSLKFGFSNTDIIKMSFEALKKLDKPLKDGETGTAVFLYQNPETMEIRPVAYTLFGEKIVVNNLAVAARDFDVPQNFKVDDFSLLFKYSHNNTTNTSKYNIGFKLKFSIDVVNSVDVEIESGAFWDGIWGGSKLIVQY